jgi:uncharacterized membrane protein
MEETFRMIAGMVALTIEAGVVLILALGTAEAVLRMARNLIIGDIYGRARREVWLRLAGWLILSLEFALAADIIRTAIAPTWDEVGKLAAIAGIRTVLNFFLGRDLAEFRETERPPSPAEPA